MTNKNKRKRENQQQPCKVIAAAAESDTLTEVPAKLTKQQKRDVKRAACNTSNDQRTLTITATTTNSNGDDEHHSPECSLDDVAFAEVAATTKQTKQQKRDAKRAASMMPVVAKASTADDIGQQTIGKPSVYKRVPVLPALSPFPDMKIDRFLNPKDKLFQKVLETCYDGFVLDKPEAHSDDFHTTFESAFLDMEKSGLFQFDLTQPAGLGTKVIFIKTWIIFLLLKEFRMI